ncbi:MAG: hypothetical protein NTY19_28635, partial [Planctomycetota bacterium]|nr:hypothetical protein [Planctomycetota bacterium]
MASDPASPLPTSQVKFLRTARHGNGVGPLAVLGQRPPDASHRSERVGEHSPASSAATSVPGEQFDGHLDVQLDRSKNLVITISGDTAGTPTTSLQFDAARNVLWISDSSRVITSGIADTAGDGSHRVAVSLASVTGERIVVDDPQGGTTLVVDFSTGPFAKTLEYRGGQAGDSTLVLTGGVVDTVSYSFHGQADGQIDVRSNGTVSSILFAGVKAFVDEVAADTQTFQFTSSWATLTLSDNSSAGDHRSSLASDLGTSIVFADPRVSLTIAAGDASGATGRAINVSGLDSTFDASLVIQGNESDTVNFSGPIDLGSGTLVASAGRLDVTQTITTHDAAVDLQARDGISILAAGIINDPHGTIRLQAPSIVHDGFVFAVGGGQVEFDAGSQGTLLVSGVVDASGTEAGQTGGTIRLLGNRVGLIGNARIDVSGTGGGGTVLVGGDYQGKNLSIQNAKNSYVGPNVRITADAVRSGDGGKVVVWADHTTRFYGIISAVAGPLFGNGGFVEVSGKVNLDFAGNVDTSSIQGSVGTLLLDPGTLDIVASGSNDGSLPVINETDDDTAPYTISASAIQTALSSNNVSLAAQTAINVTVEIHVSAVTGSNSLTLTAPTITVSSGVDILTNNGGISLNGNVVFLGSSQLDAGSGQITLGATTLSDGMTLTLGTGGAGNVSVASLAGTADGASSNVTFNVTGTVGVTGAMGTDLGTVTVTNSGGTTFSSTVDAATVTLTNTTGAIAFDGALTAWTLNTANPGYSVQINAGGTITNDANFLNTGTVTLGVGGGDTLTFNGGLATTGNASNPSGTTLNGALQTSGDQIDLGSLTLAGNSTIVTNQ